MIATTSTNTRYERVKCEPCKGTGRLKKKKDQYYRTMSNGRRGPRCWHCQGYGYIDMVKKP